MKINTSGKKEYRTEFYEQTAEKFDVGSKNGGIDAACEFSTPMLRDLERAAEHEDMTEELAEVLSTAEVTVSIESSPTSRSTATIKNPTANRL